MLTTKLLPEKENTRQNSFACLKEKKKKTKVGCLVFLKSSFAGSIVKSIGK